MVAVFALTTSAFAAVTFDPDTGEGFVGKGDVQTVFGWNNKALQDNADDVQFQAESVVVTEVSWECFNTNNERFQPRERTTTTSIQGLVESVERTRNQITGFILGGYDGDPIESSTTDGPAVNSCPSGPWIFVEDSTVTEEVSSTSTLQVSIDDINWFDLE